MQNNDLFSEIGRIFSQSESVQVLAALRQDPLLWQSLEKQEFLQMAVEQLGRQATSWSPSRLAQLALGEYRSLEVLREEPMQSLGQGLQERVLQMYQTTQHTGKPPASLREAALLALALRERRRLVGSWNGLLQEILPKPGQAEVAVATTFAIWRTPLACLYGLVPDPHEMLRNLLPRSFNTVALDWINQILLSQPIGEVNLVEGYSRLLQGLPAPFQLYLLRRLNLHGREHLAEIIAGRLVVGHPAFASLRSQTGSLEADLAGLSNRALLLQQMGAFYHLAGDNTQAFSLYNAAETTLNQWLGGLYLQRLSLQMGMGADEPGILMGGNQITQLASAADWLNNDLGAVLLSHPYASSVIDCIPGDRDGSFLQLKRARLMQQNEPAVARDLARQSVASLLEEMRRAGVPFNGDFVYSWRPDDALEILLDLGLAEEAARLAQALLEIRPVDVSLLHLASQIQERLGKLELAIQFARSAAALDPTCPDGHRLLGSLWGQAGQWELALAEWQTVLALSSTSLVADRLACAQAALQANHLDQAVELCEMTLQEDANNGAALGILGQALVARGEAGRATACLVRATLLAPENLLPWLVLARVQTEQGEPRRALETLRAAVTAVPEAAEGHLALGEACVSGGLLAEALPHLKKSVALSPHSTQNVLLYGRTLRLLGHTHEARAVLEKSRPAWVVCPEIAYEFALVLMDLGDAEGALPVLELALRNGLPVLEVSLLYARILLGEYCSECESWDAEIKETRLQQARQALQRLLEVSPENLEARFLMADILREKGELEEALAAYRALADQPMAYEPEMSWRIQWGLGRTAMRLGQVGMALVALKEAAQARPDHLVIQRDLAEVCLRADLPQEALEFAGHILQLAPDDVESLAWFADFVTRAGEPRRAVDALQRAVQLDPNRADLLVSLASDQASAGDLAEARANLVKVMELVGAGRCGVSREDLRRAAHVYLRLEDLQSALVCYERALGAAEEASSSLLFEVGQLHQRMGNYEAGLDLAQQAMDDAPESLPVHLLQADLLVKLNRSQAALAVLERALRVAQAGQFTGGGEDSAWLRGILGEIHKTFTQLMIQAGDLAAALHHAEKSLEYNPESAALCYQAANLALAQLQNDRAGRTLKAFQTGERDFPSVLFEQGRDGLNLLSLQVEMLLDGGQAGQAGDWIEVGLKEAPDNARLMAAKARLLARQGDLAAARHCYASAHLKMGADMALWLGEAALEAQCWQEARQLFESYLQEYPGEARGQLGFARALVLGAERQRLCEAAESKNYAPGVEVVNEQHARKFDQAIHAAGRLVNVGEIGRWQARGQAVFAPSAQSARALASMPSHPEDIAALVAVLRQLGNRAAAIQVARRYAEHPLVLLQLALCYLGDATAEGLATAAQAVAANPDQPIAHAVLAMLSRQAGELSDALEAYESALLIWPEEVNWHEAAGDLSMQIGSVQAGMIHYKQALALEPHNARLAFKLGQACLSDEDITGAINCLEKSTVLDPEQAHVWLNLATAYHLAEKLPQALEAARKASELNSSSAEALLIAGETALSMNLMDQALEFAQSAVRREPENSAAVLFLSNVLVLMDRVDEGLGVIEQGSPAVKAFFPVSFERAKLIRRIHGPQAALEVSEKLVKDYPEEPDLLGFLARTQAECGEVKSAERYAFRALRLDPNQPDLTLMLGRLNRKNGNLDQAVHMLSEVVRMVPDNLEAYLELGSVYQERREYGLALQVYRHAMQIAPGDYQAFYQCGLILRDSKDYSGAETMLRRAADLAPNNLSIRRQLVAIIALNLVHNQQEVTI